MKWKVLLHTMVTLVFKQQEGFMNENILLHSPKVEGV